MGSSWVRVGDLAVLWELQTFLRNLYFITVILLCAIAVSRMETPSLCCVMTACLSVWDFRFDLLLLLFLSHCSFCAFLSYHFLLFSSQPSLSFLLSLPSLPFSMYFGSTPCSFVVVTAQCYVQNDFYVHHFILPYPWANSLALIVYHCHSLTLKTATLRLGTMREAFSLQ